MFVSVFSDSVTKAVSDADRKRISDLEELELVLRQEISKLKVSRQSSFCFQFFFFFFFVKEPFNIPTKPRKIPKLKVFQQKI